MYKLNHLIRWFKYSRLKDGQPGVVQQKKSGSCEVVMFPKRAFCPAPPFSRTRKKFHQEDDSCGRD
jgi:hypothetical protein